MEILTIDLYRKQLNQFNVQLRDKRIASGSRLVNKSILSAVLILLSSILFADIPVIFSDGSVRMPPPGAMMAAGYVTIKNDSSQDMRIVSASSDSFRKIELHLSEMKGDVATMRKQEFLEVKAGETLELKHGSYHLMLMGMTSPLAKGQVISVTFKTQEGKKLSAELMVK